MARVTMPNPAALLSFLLAIVAACAAPSAHGTRPGDMTATEHLAQAREASLQAATPYGAYPYTLGGHGVHGRGSHWSPWYYYWDPRAEYVALADAHRTAADELRVRYESACALVPRGAEAVSPLAAYATASETMDRGVVILLAPEAGPPEAVLARLRCRRAWLALEPRPDAADEPLLLDGAIAVAHANDAGTVVMLTVMDRAAVAELRRRAFATIQSGSRGRRER